ncbi:MAG TPA: inositol monophosphatase family protein [Sphingobacteriaceae bacterium]|nr:inositol monophosphatase family protein [Sphingobacteriaceae bacterium]
MDFSLLAKQVVSIVTEVGDFIRKEAIDFSPDKIEYKGANDLVSYVDKTAEQKLVSALTLLLPEAGFITEEATISKTGEKYNWIIDPLDGTTNFIHGIPTYSVSVALTLNQELVIGVVYEINRDEAFYAWKGGGAFLNGKPIRISKSESFSSTLIATGFPYYDFSKQEQYLKAFSELMQTCHGLRRIGSAAVDLAYTACGRFDGFFEFNLNSWDVAGGALVVQEAGGIVIDFSGDYNFIKKRQLIAGNAHTVNHLLQILQKHFQ